ncbi:hypothetical protein P3T73_00855 [Kiritimatiellota bacterium B12222]|nr:hypothetical protein P3T73_00855 [Kiritimatiellota bacterium B12222]
MMNINKYWRNVSRSCTVNEKPYHFIAWGGSRNSEQEALENAEKKLVHIIDHFTGKEQSSWDYEYAHSEIREPIIVEDEKHPDAPEWVITRNRYGALVLNVASVVFIDVDCLPGGCLSLGSMKGKEKVLAQIVHTIERDQLACKVYETYAGYRLVLTDRLLTPDAQDSVAVMQKFKSDKLYATLCLKHECYRARLSPKPYRIGVDVPKLTIENYQDPEMVAWVKGYEATSAKYGVCKVVMDAPENQVLPEVKRILEIHDRFCLNVNLPIA